MQTDIREQGYKPYRPNLAERIADRALSVIAPQAALRNAIARERRHAFGYEGARITRARMNATRAGTITSNTPLNSSDRLQIVWEARDLEMNDPFIHGLFDRMSHYVVGPKIRIEAITGDPGDDAMLEDYLYECMQNCDLTGKSKFTELSRLIFKSVIRDGDFGSIFHDVSDPEASAMMGRPVSWIQLQSCESDVIGGYHYWIEPGLVSGVEYDSATGKVLGYRIYPRNNFGYYQSEYTRVPANQFQFLANRQRTDQYRGISAIASAVTTARDIKEILANEKLGVKWANSWAGFVKTAPGDASAANPERIFAAEVPGVLPTVGPAGAFTTERVYEDFRPGQIGYLGIGESIEAAKTDRPSSSFNGFVALLYRQVCTALCMPFGFSFDTSTLGGVPARLESAQAKRTFEQWQSFMDEGLYQPYFKRCIANGIVTGRLRFRNLTRLPRVNVCVPAHPTVDVGRESRANVTEYEAGLKSFDRIVREQGGNPREEVERMADDAAFKMQQAKQKNIPIELIEPRPTPSTTGGQRGQGGGGGAGGSDGTGISTLARKIRALEMTNDEIFDRLDESDGKKVVLPPSRI